MNFISYTLVVILFRRILNNEKGHFLGQNTKVYNLIVLMIVLTAYFYKIILNPKLVMQNILDKTLCILENIN